MDAVPVTYKQLRERKKLRHWHDSLVDYLLLNPTVPRKDIAAHFEKTPEYISQIINSDIFKAELSRRQPVAK